MIYRVIFLAILSIISLTFGVLFVNDSDGYMTMEIYRTFLYSAFYNFFNSIGKNTFVVFIQIVFGSTAVYKLYKTIQDDQKWNLFLEYTFIFILYSPYLFLHKIGNTIATEALAYPLYLLTIRELYLFHKLKKQNNIYKLAILIFFLILTRGQFLFFIPGFIIVLIYWFFIGFYKAHFLKNILLIIIVFISSTHLDKLYHYIKHDHYVSTPWTGLQIATLPFFVSDIEDQNLFEGDEKLYFKKIFNHLKIKSLNINHLPFHIEDENKIQYYVSNYSKISNKSISDLGLEFFKNRKLSRNECYIQVDRISISVGLKLLVDNFPKWFNLYIKNVFWGFGTKLNLFLYLIIFLSIVIYKKNSILNLFILSIVLFMFLNIMLVASVEHTIKRFLFYNNWVIFFIIFVSLKKLIDAKKD